VQKEREYSAGAGGLDRRGYHESATGQRQWALPVLDRSDLENQSCCDVVAGLLYWLRFGRLCRFGIEMQRDASVLAAQ